MNKTIPFKNFFSQTILYSKNMFLIMILKILDPK